MKTIFEAELTLECLAKPKRLWHVDLLVEEKYVSDVLVEQLPEFIFTLKPPDFILTAGALDHPQSRELIERLTEKGVKNLQIIMPKRELTFREETATLFYHDRQFGGPWIFFRADDPGLFKELLKEFEGLWVFFVSRRLPSLERWVKQKENMGFFALYYWGYKDLLRMDAPKCRIVGALRTTHWKEFVNLELFGPFEVLLDAIVKLSNILGERNP